MTAIACRNALSRLRAEVAAIEADRHPNPPFDAEALGTCTHTADWLARRLGGCRAGYWIDDNPRAEIGQLEGGHDFCLVANRYIVDWWATEYATLDARHPGVLDLHNPEHGRLVRRWYGDRQRWTLRPVA